MATVPFGIFKPIHHQNDLKPISFSSIPNPKFSFETNNKQKTSNKINNRTTILVTSNNKVSEEKINGSTPEYEEKKLGFVDYDKGKHKKISVQITGLGKDDIQKRYRLRVEGDRSQRDWTISEVVDRILKLKHWDDIDGKVLNLWAGRFARKNFPLLIRVIIFIFCLLCYWVGFVDFDVLGMFSD